MSPRIGPASASLVTHIESNEMADAFSSIPVIDFARLQDESTKKDTLEQLRDAIFRVGFLYLTNHGLEVRYHIPPFSDTD